MVSTCTWLQQGVAAWCLHAHGCDRGSLHGVCMHLIATGGRCMVSACTWLQQGVAAWCLHAHGCNRGSLHGVCMHMVAAGDHCMPAKAGSECHHVTGGEGRGGCAWKRLVTSVQILLGCV